jgi:F0F1-type ATP synthase epsilon subunit
VGSYAITPAGLTSTNYAITFASGTLTISKAALTITANNQNKAYGAALPALTAGYSGFVNGDTAGSLTTPPSVTTTGTASSAVGTYPITASGAVDANYTISYASGTLTVTRVGLTISANNQSKAYGAALPALTVGYSGFVNGDTASSLTTPPTVATTGTANSAVSTYPITASGAVAANYTISYVAGTLTVTQVGLVITANNQTKAYGAALPPLTVGYSGFVNSDTANSLTTAPTVTTTGTASSAAGTYPITASGAVDANYTISYVPGTLTVTPPSNPAIRSIQPIGNTGMAITWTSISNSVYRVQYKASLASTNWINLAPDVTATAGTASFTDHLSGSPQRYYRVVLLSSVTPLTPLMVVVNNASRAYGSPNPDFGGTITGLQNGDNISATYATTATTNTYVGTYAIIPTLVDPNGKLANYAVTITNGILTVTSAGLTVAANNASRTYGASNPVLSGTITGLQNDDSIAIKATYATTATVSSSAGTYPITPTLVDTVGNLGNYTVTVTNGIFTVTPAALAVTAQDKTKVYGAADPGFTAAYSGLVNGETSAVLGGSLTFSRVPGENVGAYAVTPAGLTSTNYAITFASGTLAISKAALTIMANNQSKAYGAALPSLTVGYSGFVNGDTASSLTIAPTVTTTGTASSAVGTYPITASGAVDANYTISYVPGTLTTTQVGLTITANNQSKAYGAALPSLTVSYSGFVNGDTASSLTTAPTVTTTGTASSAAGTYPITASGAVDANYTISYVAGTLTVIPAPTPTVLSIKPVGNNSMVISWPSVSNIVYRVQYKASLASTNWINLAPDVTAIAGTASFTDNLSGAPQRYYRVVLLSSVTPLRPLVVVVNNASRSYGGTDPAFGGAITGLQSGDNISATYDTTATQKTSVGTYPILPTLVDPNGKLANYSVTVTNGTLTVTPAALTVTANNASRAYGTANAAFSGTITGLQNDDSLGIKATYATTATVTSSVGTYPITSTLSDTQGRLGNYSVTITNGTLTVTAVTATGPTNLSVVRSANTNMVLTWTSVSNSVYRVEYNAILGSTNWIALTPDVTAVGSAASFTDHPAGASQRYYRILLVSSAP